MQQKLDLVKSSFFILDDVPTSKCMWFLFISLQKNLDVWSRNFGQTFLINIAIGFLSLLLCKIFQIIWDFVARFLTCNLYIKIGYTFPKDFYCIAIESLRYPKKAHNLFSSVLSLITLLLLRQWYRKSN